MLKKFKVGLDAVAFSQTGGFSKSFAPHPRRFPFFFVPST